MSGNSGGPAGKARIVLPSAQLMYEAAARWREESLIGDRSLFSGQPLDGLAACSELVEKFIEQPDAGNGDFVTKLRSQLATADAAAIQMAAELLYVHLLIVSSAAMKGPKKRELVNQVVAFREGTTRVEGDLAEALNGGVATPGTAYNTYRWKMFAYLIRVVQRVKSMPIAERRSAVFSLEAFRRTVQDVDVQSVWGQQFVLEHLLFPDVAPPVVSRDDRERILAALAPEGFTGSLEDLVSILEPNMEYGDRRGVNFYRSPYRQRWQSADAQLQSFAEWTRLVLESPNFAAHEVDWKLEKAKQVAQASRDILNGGDPVRALKTIFKGNLIDFRAADDFSTWAASDPDTLREALTVLHSDPSPRGIDSFLESVPESALGSMGARLSIAAVLLFAIDPTRMPHWRAEPANTMIRLSHGYRPQENASAGETYLVFLERIDAVQDALRVAGGPEASRLEIQGAAWTIAKAASMPEWSEEMNAAFLEWRDKKGNRGPHDVARAADPGSVARGHADGSPVTAPTLDDLAQRLSFDDAGTEWLEETIELLQQKRQLILQGPPGTGKTHIAREIAKFVSDDGEILLTQFHPGTAYEDFIQGLRPDPNNHGHFTLVDGPFLRAARSAKANPDTTVVVIIDEINRANIPAVFGELYFLLEYRDQDITLNYGGVFRLPANLLIIGTMNTADRSITSLDSALRRRFFIRDLRPGETPVDGMLRTHLAATGSDQWLAELLDAANSLIGDRDQRIGPSHFMRGDEKDARRAWNHSVLPTLQELYFNRPDKWAEFDFDALKGQVCGIASDAAAD